MKEDVFRYGENDRGFGMLTLPADLNCSPIVVILNAGLLHRAEPYRLNVLICRQLAIAGYICVRVDLSGKGDTPAREGMVNRESVALDWSHIKKSLVRRFGERNIILAGLCSGADNVIKISADDRSVKGLILLDAISPKDGGFSRRDLINKLTNIYKWRNLPWGLLLRIRQRLAAGKSAYAESIMLRDEPTMLDIQKCFQNIVERKGRVLAVFTSHALTHYNKAGQFCRAINIAGLDSYCEEVFWPQMMHLYEAEAHREKLLKRINEWARRNINSFR